MFIASSLSPPPGKCLSGDKHKELACPEPEGPDYEECFQWNDEACCTAEFTSQLAGANVTNIDGFHWTRCGALSPSCQQFFVKIECFYRLVRQSVSEWLWPVVLCKGYPLTCMSSV